MRAVFTGLPEASPEELFRRELFSSRLCQPLLSQGMRRSFVECMKLVGEAWEGTEPGLQPGGTFLSPASTPHLPIPTFSFSSNTYTYASTVRTLVT
jgi:hypothetical protein